MAVVPLCSAYSVPVEKVWCGVGAVSALRHYSDANKGQAGRALTEPSLGARPMSEASVIPREDAISVRGLAPPQSARYASRSSTRIV